MIKPKIRLKRLLLWPLGLLIVGWLLSPHLRIALAELQWNITKPSKYHLILHSSNEWARAIGVDSTIQDGHVIDQVCSVSINEIVPCDRSFPERAYTMSDLFAKAWRMTYHGPEGAFRIENCLSIRFDPRFGAPRSMTYDCLGIIDEALTISVRVEPME